MSCKTLMFWQIKAKVNVIFEVDYCPCHRRIFLPTFDAFKWRHLRKYLSEQVSSLQKLYSSFWILYTKSTSRNTLPPHLEFCANGININFLSQSNRTSRYWFWDTWDAGFLRLPWLWTSENNSWQNPSFMSVSMTNYFSMNG